MTAKVKNLKAVARLMTIAFCSVLVFATCSKNDLDLEESLPIEGITMEQYVKEIVLPYVADGKVNSCELIADNGKEVYRIDVANTVVSYRFVVKVEAGKIEAVLTGNNFVRAKSSSSGVDEEDFISDEEARGIALNLTRGGQITLCRLSYIHGEAEYEVVVINGEFTYQIFIDGYTGIINRFTRDSTPITIPVNPDNPQTNVTAEAAQSIALAKVGGGIVARVETHYAPHGIDFHVIIVNGNYRYCVHINASKGTVVNMHVHPITTVDPKANGYAAAISAEEAKAIAIQSVGGCDSGEGGDVVAMSARADCICVVTECKLEYKPHLGGLTYHIHVAKGQYEYCVELSATTGDVFKVEARYKP